MRKQKKLFTLLLVFVMVISSIQTVPVAKASEVVTEGSWIDPGNYTRGWYNTVTGKDIYGNEGTVEDPFEIKSERDLAGLSYYSNIVSTDSTSTTFGGKYIEVKATKLDLSAHYWYPIGAITNFKANFEGNNVVISNVYIGSASKAEACGKVGLFGSSFGNVSNIGTDNLIAYSGSTYAGGFIGYYGSGDVKNCYVNGTLTSRSSQSYTGGFIGYKENSTAALENCYSNVSINSQSATAYHIGGFIGWYIGGTISNCYANGNVTTINTQGSIGGFIGYAEACTINSSYATGNVTATSGCYIGGFLGNSTNGKQVDCYATGNVTIGASSKAAGFVGAFRTNSSYNCYATGNVTAGASSGVGGFAGYCWNKFTHVSSDSTYDSNWNKEQYAVSMNYQNCYAAGSTVGGSGSNVGGFVACVPQYTYSTITYKKCFWNKGVQQTLNGVDRANASKIGIGDGTACRTIVAVEKAYMLSKEFVSDLNEYVTENAPTYKEWGITDTLNKGYPYLVGVYSGKVTAVGGNTTITIDENGQASQSMNVYGTMIFPEIEPDEEENVISAEIEWGSMEYVYTSGDYDKTTKTYLDGTWAPKEVGVTNKITISNNSLIDIGTQFFFAANSGGEGTYAKLFGEFYNGSDAQVITAPVIIGKKATKDAIAVANDIFLAIGGIPTIKKNITSPEIIGNVTVTIYKSNTNEKIDPTVTPAATPEKTVAPVASETPVASVVPIVTDTPAETVKPVASETPVETKAPVASETPTETAAPVETKAPAETATPVVTETPAATVSPQ